MLVDSMMRLRELEFSCHWRLSTKVKKWVILGNRRIQYDDTPPKFKNQQYFQKEFQCKVTYVLPISFKYVDLGFSLYKTVGYR